MTKIIKHPKYKNKWFISLKKMVLRWNRIKIKNLLNSNWWRSHQRRWKLQWHKRGQVS
jgi:hypothetical protein